MTEKQERIRKVNNVEHLIVSNSLDFSTDYVCYELRKRNAKYIRLNRDRFAEYKIEIELLSGKMSIEMEDQKFIVTQSNLRSVYYRAPVFLREMGGRVLSLQEQLYRSQWSAFIRNLTIFEDARWMNNPVSTYKAENKALQLKYANELGFRIPSTLITNNCHANIIDENTYIVKSLDTALFTQEDTEMFTYSNIIKGNEIKISDLKDAPVIIQDCIQQKVDLRVTAIGDVVYAVKILKDRNGIEGDWRRHKDGVEFIPYELPEELANKCKLILLNFNLIFGAIDLAYANGEYYFIEINPTGEWAWLVDSAGQLIHKDIVDKLTEGA